MKGGATVPLKFEVFADGTELTDLTTVTGLTVVKVTCDSGATADEIEVTTSGSTALRYDTTPGMFVYNWKTPQTSGVCYQVRVTTADASAITALFRAR